MGLGRDPDSIKVHDEEEEGTEILRPQSVQINMHPIPMCRSPISAFKEPCAFPAIGHAQRPCGPIKILAYY